MHIHSNQGIIMEDDNHIPEDDENFEYAYEKIYKLILELSKEDQVDPLLIAGILSTSALSIYKTCLSPEEYDEMIDQIYEFKDNIKSFKSPGQMFNKKGRIYH